jgi:hypothetical protein
MLSLCLRKQENLKIGASKHMHTFKYSDFASDAGQESTNGYYDRNLAWGS